LTLGFEYIQFTMMSDYIDPSNKELLNDFFEEAQLQIESLEQNILLLENNPADRNAIDEIFRAAHTLKGGSATVNMDEIAGFTHIIENLLDDIRSEKIKVTGDVIDGLLESIDIAKKMVRYRQSGNVYNEDNSGLESKLNNFLSSHQPASTKKGVSNESGKIKKSQTSGKNSKEISEYELLELSQGIKTNQSLYKVRVHFNQNAAMNTVGGIQIFAALKEIGQIIKTIPDFESLYEDNFFPLVDYFLATTETIEKIQFLCDIPDIVLHTEIEIIKEGTKQPVSEAQKPKTEEEIPEQGKKSEGSSGEEESVKLEAGRIGSISTVLRVDSKRIDELMNLVSEAVITKASFNQISTVFGDLFISFQETKTKLNAKIKDFSKTIINAGEKLKSDTSDGKEFKKQIEDEYSEISNGFSLFESRLKETITKIKSGTQGLGRITNELQEGVMRIRMVPVSHIFSRFPRLVRDLSKDLKKNVKLHTEGEETELDKSVIEDLIDPLIHCVRNSLDHGIESIEERARAGKSSEGNIFLRATNEGNMIIIEIEDDGKGIDIDAVREKAIAQGVIHPDKFLTDVEAYNLIFEPGFSTAKKITDLSGRGVGLDVVRKKVEKLNGSVSVWSKKGEGSTFTIKLPLTLAIIQGLLVRVGDEVYSIPITSVIESHRIKPQEIRLIDNYEVFNLREEVISIIRLNRLFKIAIDENAAYNYVVLVGSEKSKVGLMVDSLIGEEDVVIKPLKDKYSNSPGIAGATILGDGTVSLILDVSQLLDLDRRIEKSKRQEREARIV
jgi:two-component system chemotaxis sensor kinase CheA